MLLPSVLTTFLICLPLPAAVSLYYLTSGLFTALQQAVLNTVRVYRLCAD